MFNISDSYNDNYSACCRFIGEDTIDDCCDTAIEHPVQIYIDQVVISQGGEASSVQ